MNEHTLISLITSLAGRDPDCEDRAGVGAILRDLNRLSGWVEARKVRCTRQLRRLEAEGRSESVGSALLDESRHSAAEANRTRDRERVCNLFPGLEDQLAAGQVSADHLDALSRLTKNLNDQDRSDLAARADEVLGFTAGWVSECERRARQLIDEIRTANRPDTATEDLNRQRQQSQLRRWNDKATGMCFTQLALDPVRDTTLHNIIDAHLARLRAIPGNRDLAFTLLHAQAVYEAVTGQTTPTGTNNGDDRIDTGDRRLGAVVTAPEIVVHVDAHTFAHGQHPAGKQASMCETIDGVPVPESTLQRLCCDAVIQAIIVRPDGTFDQLCREQRLASRKQRRALAAMYSTCAHPHCSVPFTACRIHHVIAFNRGGLTILANLIPVCEQHHHQIHEGGWQLSMTPDRTTTWTRPDGEMWWTGPSPNRRRIVTTRSPAEQTVNRSAKGATERCERPPDRPQASLTGHGPPTWSQPALL